MRRPFIFVCTALALVLAACTSNPARNAPPSILDVIEQSDQTPAGLRSESGTCPGNTVAVCIAETRMMNPTKCACLDRRDAMGLH